MDTALYVFAHNIETVPRLYDRVRPGAGYVRSLEVLSAAGEISREPPVLENREGPLLTKSGLMLARSMSSATGLPLNSPSCSERPRAWASCRSSPGRWSGVPTMPGKRRPRSPGVTNKPGCQKTELMA